MYRRTVLGAALGGLAGVMLPDRRPSFAAGRAELTRVTSDITVIEGLGGNVVVATTGAGLVVVDSGGAPTGADLLATLAEVADGAPVDTLFNTHWHLDQVGSNAELGRRGATIVAHAKTRAHLSTPYYLPELDRYQAPLPVEARPVESFYTTGTRVVGGRRVEYGHLLEAHTDGDCYVRFADANVVAVGDAVSPVSDPALDWFGGGWIGGRVDSLSLLLDITDDATRFIPSVGPVIGRAEVQHEHDTMLLLFERMVELIRQGMGAEDIVEAGVMDDVGRLFDDPLRFVRDAHKSLWAHHNTLSHDIV